MSAKFNYINTFGFISRITESIKSDQTYLPLPDGDYAWLRKKLKNDWDWTMVELRDGNAIELVRIVNACGRFMVLRGRDGSTPLAFPCGTGVRSELSPSVIEQIVCQLDSCKEDNTMKYKALTGLITNLTDKFADIDTDLPIPDDKIALILHKLGEGNYSFLKVIDRTKIEYIYVANKDGKLFTQRGAEASEAQSFPQGSCVKWELTPSAVEAIVCQMECCSEENK